MCDVCDSGVLFNYTQSTQTVVGPKALNSLKDPPTTQKAKGLWTLYRQGSTILEGVQIPNALFVAEKDHITDKLVQTYPFFRGCPERPRHGFVESRKVESVETGHKLWDEVKEADPNAELLAMAFIPATCSGVLIAESGVLALGPGHDGATAGKDSFKLAVAPYFPGPGFRKMAAIAEDDHTYIELLADANARRVYAVQARSGPPDTQPAATDYIPAPVTVKRVEVPNPDDFREWELRTQHICGCAGGKPPHNPEEGVVAWQKKSNLASHSAVHCRLHKIPFLTGEKAPQVGDHLVPPVQQTFAITKTEFCKGVAVAMQHNDLGRGLPPAIAIMHNAHYLAQTRYYGRLLGYAATCVFRACVAVCAGEYRHYSGGGAKSDIYHKVASYTLKDCAEKLSEITPAFMHAGAWQHSYGGWPWGRGGISGMALYNRMSELDYDGVLAELNKLIWLAHNTGWLFNKFMQQTILDRAAARPQLALVLSMYDIYNILTYTGKGRPVPKRTTHQASSWDLNNVKYNGLTLEIQINGKWWLPLKFDTEGNEWLTKCLENV